MVRDFHVKFGLPDGTEDVVRDAIAFRTKFLLEEVDEFVDSATAADRVGMLDALVDLVYVAQGTALFMGVTPEQWNEAMRAVHSCNMRKVRVERAEDSKRGSAFDVKKPPGWVGPEARLREILNVED
jgi:predicted HAD superfamily Cof-like phosphohydrolase